MIKLKDILQEQSQPVPETLEQIWDGRVLKVNQGDSNLVKQIQNQVYRVLSRKDKEWLKNSTFRPDGDFGENTAKAVARAVGIENLNDPRSLAVGPNTLEKLGFEKPDKLSLETRILAATITGEAMGDLDDMQAVANIILNRSIVRNMTPSAVALERKQFSMWNQIAGGTVEEKVRNVINNWGGGLKSAGNLKYWKYGVKLAKQIQNKTLVDNTGGATHYFTGTRPDWAIGDKYKMHKVIGRHEYGRDTATSWAAVPVKR